MTVIKKFLKLTISVINESRRDYVGVYSAQSAFFMTISFVPFIMFLLSMIKFLPFSQQLLIDKMVSLFPSGAKGLVASFVGETYEKSGAAIISITAVSTLWASSIGVHAIVKGINNIFCANEQKNYIKVRFMSIVYTLLIMALLILCLGFLVFGNTITETILKFVPQFYGTAIIIMSLRAIAAIILLSIFFAVMYAVVPGRKAKIISQIPGAVLCAAGWVGISKIFSYYYENLSDYSYLYGSLSVLVFFMLWLFICIYVMFLGAEINKCLKK